MRVMLLAAATLAGLAMAVPARAQRLSKVDGATLLGLCSGRQPAGCDAYVSGIADAIQLMQRSSPEPHDAMKLVACIPPSVTGPALRATVISYGQGHTGEQKLPAGIMVMSALRASYPCKEGQPS